VHFPRSLSITALTTFALTAAGTPLAQSATAADPGSTHTAVSRPRPGTVTLPAQGLDRFPYLLDEQRRHGEAAQTSTNWSGYAATGGTYTSVSSSWVEPSVSCSATGTVAFWVGLDGLGSGSVEQTGTAVDCSSGFPQSFAWWETYPADSVQQYSDPVSAGDKLTSTVTAESDGRYDLVLTDSTRGWTENNVVGKPAGASNASAEIIAEAVSNGFGVTPLPNFDSVRFTGSTMNGDTLQASRAQGITMTSDTGAVVATASAADSSGDFTVDYDGSSGTAPEPPESILSHSPQASDFLDRRL
jgi:Peptidase A4 family